MWDRIFGTYDDPGRVVVPRRMAPTWLLDEDGEVRPEHAADYEARGRVRVDGGQRDRDHDDAFSNRPPLAGDESPEPELPAVTPAVDPAHQPA